MRGLTRRRFLALFVATAAVLTAGASKDHALYPSEDLYPSEHLYPED